jgi:phage head maturation protease
MVTAGADLRQFKKNPIMLWNHNRSWGDDTSTILPIGHWDNVRVEEGRILAEAVFDADEFSSTIAGKVESGTLRMCSVGVKPVLTSSDPKHVKPGQRYETVLKWQLKEVSIVDIGANDNALVMLYDDDDRVIELSSVADTGRRVLKKLNFNLNPNKTSMDNEIRRLLGLSDTSTGQEVLQAVKPLLVLKEENDRLTVELAAINKRQKEALSAEAVTLVDAAIRDGRLNAAGKEKFLKFFETDHEGARVALAAIPARGSVTRQIDASTGVNNKELSVLEKMSWDELDKGNKLATLKATYPEVYKEKFTERFGTKPRE